MLVGVARLAVGKADGLQHFPSSVQGYLSSLAPLLALPLAGVIIGLFQNDERLALLDLGLVVVALLMPAVVSYELARLWQRTDQWLRFMTAYNWCQWILPVLASLLILPVSALVAAGMPMQVASTGMLGLLVLYGFWLLWFLGRSALSLSGFRAALLVLTVNLATAIAIATPLLLANPET